jgi:multiple sugar transport system permease protein
MRRQWSAYLFLAPVFLLFSVFTAFSVGYAFWLSFHKWNILEPAKPFVGLDNYRRLIDDERFHEPHSIRSTSLLSPYPSPSSSVSASPCC